MKTRLFKVLKNNRFLAAVAVIIVISLSLMITSVALINQKNKECHVYEQNEKVSSPDLSISMEIPFRSDGTKNCWIQDDVRWGAQYDIYIQNNTKLSFNKYTLKMTVPDNTLIDSSWNGVYSHKGNTIEMTPIKEAQNLTIAPGLNVKFGFVLHSDQLIETSSFILEGYYIQSPVKNRFFLISLAVFIFALILLVAGEHTFIKLEAQEKKSNEVISSVIKLCASFIDTRDEYTKMHSSHVALYSKQIALEMGFSEKNARNVYYAGILHDIGKVLVPKNVLCKPGKLNDEEWNEMKKHTTYGAEILADFDAIPGVVDGVLYHHERYDGKGYMSGLSGKNIPLIARIICVADSYDAMATDRSYRKRLPVNEIISELEKNRGSQFDPEIADIMIDLIKSGKL